MPDVYAQPDLLAAIRAALVADATLDVLADVIAAELPTSFTSALIIAEGPGTAVFDGWLWRVLIDFHAIAKRSTTGRATTSAVARQALAALVSLRGTVQGDCVITQVQTIQAPFWLPDPSFTPAAARFVGQVAVTYHPAP